MPPKSNPAEQAQFIFRGTVQRMKAATMTSVPVDARTTVVRVDEVLQAPRALAKYGGKDVTVQLPAGKVPRLGDQAVFYTNAWQFGEGVAVRAVDYHAVHQGANLVRSAARAAAPLAATPPDAVANLAAREIKRSIDDADLVVSGKVSAVRLAPETLTPATATGVRTAARVGPSAGAGDEPDAGRRRISEHDPLWHEAVIEIANVEKGVHSPRQVVVRFPGSNDIAWRRFPKFKPGQSGVWMLRKDDRGGIEPTAGAAAPRRRAARGAAATAAAGATMPSGYIAPEQQAFQPIEQVELVRDLLRQSGG